MQLIIDEIINDIRATDAESLLSPSLLNQIVEAVLAAVDEREAHGRRVGAEQSVGASRSQRFGE